MPCCMTESRSAIHSARDGIATPAAANSSATRRVAGSQSRSVYFAKKLPSAYREVANPAKVSPRSIASRFDVRTAW